MAPKTRERLKKLPAFPPVALKLMTLLARDSIDYRELANVASGDATIMGRLLSRANSAEFALTDQVKQVQHALNILGVDRTRELIATIAAACYAEKAARTEELRRCWAHMTATAVIGDEIARVCGVGSGGIAYTAGILHDIGRIGLLVAYPHEYEEIMRDAAYRCIDLLDFERYTFGVDHAEAGRWLAEHWGLPDELREVCGRHHDRITSADLDLLSIIHAGCRLADNLGYEVSKPLVPMTYPQLLADLPGVGGVLEGRVSAEDLQARVQRRIGDLAGMVEGPPPEAVQEKAAEAPEADPEVETLISELFEEPSKPATISMGAYSWLAVAIAAILGICWWAVQSGFFVVQASR
jgi:HD-like signal output (HDOD) protein